MPLKWKFSGFFLLFKQWGALKAVSVMWLDMVWEEKLPFSTIWVSSWLTWIFIFSFSSLFEFLLLLLSEILVLLVCDIPEPLIFYGAIFSYKFGFSGTANSPSILRDSLVLYLFRAKCGFCWIVFWIPPILSGDCGRVPEETEFPS